MTRSDAMDPTGQMASTASEDRTEPFPPREPRRRNVLVSGSSGLVGEALLRRLTWLGEPNARLVRGAGLLGQVSWSPSEGRLDPLDLHADAVVHLAGENIAAGRWTRSRMEAIRDSRVKGTRLLAEGLARSPSPPQVLVSASAIGFYGNRGEELLSEASSPGSGFLAEVCREWEAATEPARAAGIRVVNLRIGLVLARNGGALAKMLPPFRLGLGGRLGSGRQYMSWITLEDLVSVIWHALEDDGLEGAVNASTPNPVTNLEFTKTLGRVLARPTVLPVPAPAVRLAFGRMADEILLASQRVDPRKLIERDFDFESPWLEGALRSVL